MLARAVLLSSPRIVHGFTDRTGGVSRGRFESLNLGRRWGDEPANVDENLRRVAEAGGFEPEELRLVRQVHGATALRVSALTPGAEADALWARASDRPVVVGVMTADCVPVLLADHAATAVAAIHSGWRGTVANVVGATIAALVADGVDPSQLRAAIGPCIEVEAFEVGEEVASQFAPAHVRREPGRRPHVDLVAAVRAQLEDAGVSRDCIERVGGCTCRNPERYFSYRRDGAGIGQMLAFIGIR
ncbi:peptidoglycan editing factor PgeF [Nannocystis pusilla]|uniref:Purine nucleoside phosphorylase n=1 Tax=Nannocystis pusilla TaxID=889268 RepID=A0ABS7TYX8_9BACT|nr:peptidoglycan editing factor PgeF [Nannocystis pusilla]